MRKGWCEHSPGSTGNAASSFLGLPFPFLRADDRNGGSAVSRDRDKGDRKLQSRCDASPDPGHEQLSTLSLSSEAVQSSLPSLRTPFSCPSRSSPRQPKRCRYTRVVARSTCSADRFPILSRGCGDQERGEKWEERENADEHNEQGQQTKGVNNAGQPDVESLPDEAQEYSHGPLEDRRFCRGN